MNPKIGIIIVNLNRKDEVLACLASVMESSYINFEILVVDNNSTDGSIGAIHNNYPEVKITQNSKNLGFTGGNNIGIQYFINRNVDYFFLLNNDSVVEPSTLSSLVNVAIKFPEAGFIGAKIIAKEDRKTILHAGGFLTVGGKSIHRGLGLIDTGQFNNIDEVDFVSGCGFMVSGKAISRIGVLDENYFAYHEEIDWCYRGKQAGYKVLFNPDAKVYHPDTRQRDVNSAFVTYYIARNSLLFAKKYKLRNSGFLKLFLVNIRTLISWTMKPKWKGKRSQRDALAHALVDFAFNRFGESEKW